MLLVAKRRDLLSDEHSSHISNEKQNLPTSILPAQHIVRRHMDICQNEELAGE